MARSNRKSEARQAAQRPALRQSFVLFVTPNRPSSVQALQNARTVCDECLGEDYELEVVDIYQDLEAVRSADIVATPTLIRKHPQPSWRVVGDLSNKRRLRACLES